MTYTVHKCLWCSSERNAEWTLECLLDRLLDNDLVQHWHSCKYVFNQEQRHNHHYYQQRRSWSRISSFENSLSNVLWDQLKWSVPKRCPLSRSLLLKLLSTMVRLISFEGGEVKMARPVLLHCDIYSLLSPCIIVISIFQSIIAGKSSSWPNFWEDIR